MRLLTWEGPPTLARPLRTVLAGVKSWTVLDPGRGMRVPVMLAVFQGHRVHLVRGLQRILEVSEGGLDPATHSIRLHASADGSLLAAEVHPDNQPESARVMIWRVGAPNALTGILSTEELEGELTAKAVTMPKQ